MNFSMKYPRTSNKILNFRNILYYFILLSFSCILLQSKPCYKIIIYNSSIIWKNFTEDIDLDKIRDCLKFIVNLNSATGKADIDISHCVQLESRFVYDNYTNFISVKKNVNVVSNLWYVIHINVLGLKMIYNNRFIYVHYRK